MDEMQKKAYDHIMKLREHYNLCTKLYGKFEAKEYDPKCGGEVINTYIAFREMMAAEEMFKTLFGKSFISVRIDIIKKDSEQCLEGIHKEFENFVKEMEKLV